MPCHSVLKRWPIQFLFISLTLVSLKPLLSSHYETGSPQYNTGHQFFLLLLPHIQLLCSSIAREPSIRYDFRPQLWPPPYHVDSDSTPWRIGLFVTQEDPTARLTHEAVESSEHGWPMILKLCYLPCSLPLSPRNIGSWHPSHVQYITPFCRS